MEKVEYPRGRWWNVVFFLTALLVMAADQLSKFWVRSNLTIGESLPETGLFQLTHVHNTGAVFGSFQNQSLLLTIIASIAVISLPLLVLLFSRRFTFLNGKLSALALGLILGGTAGNLIDRLHQGYVTDFIDIGIWPTFNIADSSLVIGVILFAYSLRSLARTEKQGEIREGS